MYLSLVLYSLQVSAQSYDFDKFCPKSSIVECSTLLEVSTGAAMFILCLFTWSNASSPPLMHQ